MTKQELASKIWEIANNLRGKIKASEYKDYIISFMFYKYLCDKEEALVKSWGGTKEEIKDPDNREMIRAELGYFIEYDDLFSEWQLHTGRLSTAVVSNALSEFNKSISSSNKRVFLDIFSVLEMGLSKLGDSSGSRDKAIRDIVDLVKDIPTVSDKYDVCGFILEYWVKRVSVIEDGSYFTPHEVSTLKAKIIAHYLKDRKDVSVYDPTSGSGGLLLTIGKEVGKYVGKDNIKYFAQELINETYNICRMNLVMKGIDAKKIVTRNADTLSDDWPYFDDETSYEPLFVDATSANPPYSLKWDSTGKESDPRFKYGLAPSGKADLAFLQHCLYHLKPDGIMTIVLPHGVLFRGGAEAAIRKNLIDNNNIEAIIGLPANLFYATGIPTIIVVLRKNRSDSSVLFVDASQNYVKEAKQNVLRESDIKRIFDAVVNRSDIDNFCRVVDKDEIVANDYNLNIPRYVSASNSNDVNDLYSVMTGAVGENELSLFSRYWNQFKTLKDELTIPCVDAQGYHQWSNGIIQDIINSNTDVRNYKKRFENKVRDFKGLLIQKLISDMSSVSIETIDELSEELFKLFADLDLIDRYDLYQVLANHWPEIEQDIMSIQDNGFDICRTVLPNMVLKKDSKTKKSYEKQEGWFGAVIPFGLVKNKYFQDEFTEIAKLNSEYESNQNKISEIINSFDEDTKVTFNKNRDDSEKEFAFDEKAMKKAIKDNDLECVEQLKEIKSLIESNKAIKKSVDEKTKEIDEETKSKIESLSEDEIIDLLKEKWFNSLCEEMLGIEKLTFDSFAKELEDIKAKYAHPLSEIEKDIADTNKELIGFLGELTGSETDMRAIENLMEVLGYGKES